MSTTPTERMERGEWVNWVTHLIIQNEQEKVAEQREAEFKQALDSVLGLDTDGE